MNDFGPVLARIMMMFPMKLANLKLSLPSRCPRCQHELVKVDIENSNSLHVIKVTCDKCHFEISRTHYEVQP